ncbi:hypothetical protein M8C21_026765 [Ambrosia artemisiifolia]|uniref:Thioesterase domain-containing protein n=1 Tax=Ambrosia artemisiifolia TaxID=4212 RepID=A0AAD5D7T4_AMBAR|nr:hypothetical protein M8C21_026765 [Ambrosia artemisiifolia]
MYATSVRSTTTMATQPLNTDQSFYAPKFRAKTGMKKGNYTKLTRLWFQNSSNFELDGLALQGLKIDHIDVGLVRCSFVVLDHLSDRDGNWNVGAIAILIDSLAAGAVFSMTGGHLATVDYTMSFYSTVKVKEEVEIEAKVVGEKGNLASVIIDIKKKSNGEKVVIGKQWMHSVPIKTPHCMQSKL